MKLITQPYVAATHKSEVRDGVVRGRLASLPLDGRGLPQRERPLGSPAGEPTGSGLDCLMCAMFARQWLSIVALQSERPPPRKALD